MSGADKALVKNIQDQLVRLLTQLEDINNEKESLTPDEYTSMKEETMDELKDLERTLSKIEQGSMSSLDDLTSTKLAIRAAISEAFRTPEIAALFAQKQPAALRLKLESLERDVKSGKTSTETFSAKKCEILTAIQRLKGDLSDEEIQFLMSFSKIPTFELEQVTNSVRSIDETKINKAFM